MPRKHRFNIDMLHVLLSSSRLAVVCMLASDGRVLTQQLRDLIDDSFLVVRTALGIEFHCHY